MVAAPALLPGCPPLPEQQVWAPLPAASTSVGAEGADPACCSLPWDSSWTSGRSLNHVGSLQLALFLPQPQGTAGRSSEPQLCDSPAAGWLCAKATQSLGGQRGAAPPAPGQLSFAPCCPTRGFAQLFPPVRRLHPSSSGPPKEQPGWVLGVFLPVGWLQSLALGGRWCGLVGYCRKLS